MFSKLVQLYKLITNHNCAYFKANRSQATSFKFLFLSQVKSQQSHKYHACYTLVATSKMLSNSLYGHEGRRLKCSFSLFPLKETILNNSWQQQHVCYANRIPHIRHSKHMESCGYTEVTDNWEGHLPREPSRPEDSSSLMHPGMMTTEVSHNVLTFFDH